MSNCKICGKSYEGISQELGVCRNCIRSRWHKARKFIDSAFQVARGELGLPSFPPQEIKGILCRDCGNMCKIPKNGKGYCGLVINKNEKLERLFGTKEKGLFSYYYDEHPTNCVAANWCGATGIGYPTYSVTPTREVGYYNLSCFSGSCSYACEYCQNFSSWHEMVLTGEPTISVEELCRSINERTTCVCFFGGCPSTQPEFVFEFMRLAKKTKEKLGLKVLRICLETNGNFSWHWLKKIAKLSLESGGGIKVDLKAAKNSNINIALSGVSNEISYQNFEKLVEFHSQRPEVPFLRASTLLVPHYIDISEVRSIVKFIASLDKTIPYSLLAFYPHYRFSDVGFTSKRFAEKCYQIAKRAGLQKVNLGNVHLLKDM
jgi:pyruvate formate lyase activating enzyme